MPIRSRLRRSGSRKRPEPGSRGPATKPGTAGRGETLPLEDFRRQVEVNLTAQVAVTQATLPLIRRGRGRIVFISSIGGRVPPPPHVRPPPPRPLGGAVRAAFLPR